MSAMVSAPPPPAASAAVAIPAAPVAHDPQAAMTPPETPSVLAGLSPIEQHMVSCNAEYCKTFAAGALAPVPAQGYAIVTCMDCRIDDLNAFGTVLGGAHIIRNAGASARDAFRSLVISQRMLKTKEILVIKHTHCGMQLAGNEIVRDKIIADIASARGQEAAQQAAVDIKDMCWECWPEVSQAVRDDVLWLRSQSTLDGNVTGWIYDVKTGSLEKVDV